MTMSQALDPQAPRHVPPELVREFDVYADERLIHEDPYVLFRDMALNYPEVFYTTSNGGHWVITGREAVDRALRDHEVFGSEFGGIPNTPEHARMFIPLQLDPPEHTPFRKLLNPMFGPKAIWKLEDSTRELCRELVGAVVARGECEFVEEIALPLPVWTFMRQMALPEERYKEFSGWVHDLVTGGTEELRNEGFVKVVSYLHEVVMEREPDPEGDWVRRMLASEIDGRRLDREKEVWPIANLLFLGGLDTVKNMLSHFMRTLAKRPDLQKRLAEEPSIAPDAIEELFRYMGGSNPPRMLRKDIVFHGAPMRKGDLAVVYTPTASPPDQINDPSFIDFDRKEKWHFGFGAGPHLCVGAVLARLEIRILFEEWFAAIPRYGLKPGTRPRFRPGFVNSVEELRLVWPPA